MSGATTAILYAPGTNCHEETAAAIELAGGRNSFCSAISSKAARGSTGIRRP